jgi:hypothetical protein
LEPIRDLIEAFHQRLRAPVFGYTLLALMLINWKAFFYLFFAESDAAIRISFFTMNTSAWTLIALPLVFGIGSALLAPWVQLWTAYWAANPTVKKRLTVLAADHKVKLAQAEFRELQARSITAVVEAAKQKEQLNKIEDKEIIEEAKKEISIIEDNRIVFGDPMPLFNSDRIHKIDQNIQILQKNADIAEKMKHRDLLSQLGSEIIDLNNEKIRLINGTD